MNDNIKIKYKDKEFHVKRGATLLDLSKNYKDDFKYPIVLASVNNYWTELREEITKDSEIKFYDLTSSAGNRVYLSGLIFVMLVSIKNLYNDKLKVQIHHSIDKSILIEPNRKINKEEVIKIKEEMQRLILNDISINKVNSKRLDVLDYYNSVEEYKKAEALKYNPGTTVTMYELENEYNFFYTHMPVSTKVLNHFDLTYLDDEGFLLRLPSVYDTENMKEYEHKPKLYELFKSYRTWETAMDLKTASDLNKAVSTGKIGDIIKLDEIRQNNKLMDLAKRLSKKKELKVILIAGPSSSGKTTTSKKLELYLQGFGSNPVAISMDDYFIDRDKTPRLPNGNPDYENVTAVDLELFEKQIGDLIQGKEVNMPTYNFITGKKEYKNKLQLNKDDVLVIEGIHALNPIVLEHIDDKLKYKIYLSALTEINIDNHNRIKTTDNRLLRRMIRDHKTRGHSVDHTLKTWRDVRDGEETYIFPYQEQANIIFNTALVYEFGVLKTYAEPLLYSVTPDSPNYNEAIRLINYLRVFLPIPSEDIPDDSILREFIGNGYFKEV